MIDIKEAATRKIGPLPAFAWGGIVGGGILVWKMLRGGDGASSEFGQVVGGGNIDFEDGAGGGSNPAGGGVGGADGVPDAVVPPWQNSGFLGPPSHIIPIVDPAQASGNGAPTIDHSDWSDLVASGRTVGRRTIDPFGTGRTVTVDARG